MQNMFATHFVSGVKYAKYSYELNNMDNNNMK